MSVERIMQMKKQVATENVAYLVATVDRGTVGVWLRTLCRDCYNKQPLEATQIDRRQVLACEECQRPINVPIVERTVSIELPETLAQMLVIALRNAEDRQLGEINFGKLLPSVEKRQVFMKAYHDYNGDPEEYDPQRIDYFNPNWSIGMLWTQIRDALEAAQIDVLADKFDPYSVE